MFDTAQMIDEARAALEAGRLRNAGRLLSQATFTTTDPEQLAQIDALTLQGLAKAERWWQRSYFRTQEVGARLQHFRELAATERTGEPAGADREAAA